MVQQVIDISKAAKLKLTAEEKTIFFDLINKFPKGIYDIKKDSPFMNAVNDGNVERAFDILHKIGWNRVALAILREIRIIVKLQSEEDKNTRIQNLEQYISKQFADLKPSKMIKCPECGEHIASEHKTCPCCGTLLDE